MYTSVMQRTQGAPLRAKNAAKNQFVKDIYEETPFAKITNKTYDVIDNSFIDRGGEDDDDD